MVLLLQWSVRGNGRAVTVAKVGIWSWCSGGRGVVNVVLLRWSGCGNDRGAEVVGYGKSHGGLDDCP